MFQCCEDSCVSGSYYDCGGYGFHCLDPAFFDPELVAEYPDCTGDYLSVGDGMCDPANNVESCDYDGGDCCFCSCMECGFSGLLDCLDPAAQDDLYECSSRPPANLPCAEGVQQAWTVEDSEQARALAAAVNCSGGSFEVEWRGRVVVDETIYVVDGTVLIINGADAGAVIDGNMATRPFTVVNAALHLSDVAITSGASVSGGAIAAVGSVLAFHRTSFVGNSATWHGGAVLASDGSNVSCTGGVTFANNIAQEGSAMFVTGSSTVLCGGLWTNNTATGRGGALAVENNSSVSWGHDTTFSFNSGGALGMWDGSRASWSGATTFLSNSDHFSGGAVSIAANSTASWSGATTFVGNSAPFDFGYGGAVAAWSGSTVSWSGSTEFIANTAASGGAVFGLNGASISWTGTTGFRSNTARREGGAVTSFPLDVIANPLESIVDMNGPTTFFNNSCGASGGALALLGGLSVNIGAVDVSFVNNTADVSGGAVFISATAVGPNFLGVDFVSNYAETGGAVSSVASGSIQGVSWELTPTTFERCHFIENVAETTGGAVDSAAGQDAFVNSVFEGNTAGTGGALRLAGTASIGNCSFVDNVSDDGGGTAVSNIGSVRYMENVSFSGNVFYCDPGMFLDSNEVRVGSCGCAAKPSS